MPPVLAFNHWQVQLNGSREPVQLLDDISATIEAGSITALVGESGSGKSLTALSILGLLPKDMGAKGSIQFHPTGETSITLNQLNAHALKQVRGRQISMIFQEPMTSLNPLMTCGAQLSESLQRIKNPGTENLLQRSIAWFEKVGLPDPASILHRYPHELSGGQQQRVMIAMAACTGPSLLIADEPTTALDVRVQRDIMELLAGLCRENGMSMLLITHDLGLVADYADEVMVMYRGRIVEKGPTKEVLKTPGHAYTKALLACRPAAHEPGSILPGVQQILADPGMRIQAYQSEADTAPAPDQKTEALLKVESLRVSYPGKKKSLFGTTMRQVAVDDISFRVFPNEIVGIVGESGSGKTTVGRAILQLIRPDSGSIWLNGTDLCRLSSGELKKMRAYFQVVFQDPYGSLNPRMTVGNAIMEPLMLHQTGMDRRKARDEAAALLETVELQPDHLNRYPHQFSGGQRQRICIARALATNPSFMIFDESVSALDVSMQAQILNLLNTLKKNKGLTALFISHDLSVIRHIADRTIVMQKGRMVESGPTVELFQTPGSPYTRSLLDAIPGKSLVHLFK
mgnify:CR=1 FL=1